MMNKISAVIFNYTQAPNVHILVEASESRWKGVREQEPIIRKSYFNWISHEIGEMEQKENWINWTYNRHVRYEKKNAEIILNRLILNHMYVKMSGALI
jgi:hypothetical protein